MNSESRISELVSRLMDTAAATETITVGRVLQIFGVRGFAFLLMILSILNIVIFMVPFLSFFLGLPMVILTAQMIIGLRAPMFPRVIRTREISRTALLDGLGRAIIWIQRIENYIKPRLPALSAPELMRVHAFAALILAIMVTLPIPVVNVPPSVAILFLAIGILSRDGIFILMGYATGLWCLWLFKSLDHIAHAVAKAA